MNWLLLAVVAGMVGTRPAPAPAPAPGPAPQATAVAQAPEPWVRVGWGWPLRPRSAVVHPFAPPARRWLAGHRGVDLAAAVGQPVLAPADGVVTFVGRVAGRPVVSVRHADGLRSTYEPVTGELPAGSMVRAGDVIGYLSDEPGHCTPATCLHWGALAVRTYVDPLGLLGRVPIILLPVP